MESKKLQTYAPDQSDSLSSFSTKPNIFSLPKAPLAPVEETPDFQNPYSHLSLFLSHTIKKELGTMRKWSWKLQEELLRKIAPEFQKQFPQYQLGVTALKKIWEKVQFYTEQLQGKKEAIGSDGKLNVAYFIKENLKTYLQQKALSFLHPYQLARQIASKMGECIATLEGTKPKVDLLTQMVWSLQKHLLRHSSLQPFAAPQESFDAIDQLLVRTITEQTAQNSTISLEALEERAAQALSSLSSTLPKKEERLAVSKILSSLFSFPSSATSTFFAIHHPLQRHTDPSLCTSRLLALHTLALALPPSLSFAEFALAVEDVWQQKKKKEALASLYPFLYAELSFDIIPASLEKAQQELYTRYQQALTLPPILNQEELEILTWQNTPLSSPLSEAMEAIILQEGTRHWMAAPHKRFSTLVEDTLSSLQKLHTITTHKKWEDAHRRLHLWCLQHDMLYRGLPMPTNTPLASIIQELWVESPISECSLPSFLSLACDRFLQHYPHLRSCQSQVKTQVIITCKHLWFNQCAQESSFDRFLAWHLWDISAQEEKLPLLEERCAQCLPLIPFDYAKAEALVTKMTLAKNA